MSEVRQNRKHLFLLESDPLVLTATESSELGQTEPEPCAVPTAGLNEVLPEPGEFDDRQCEQTFTGSVDNTQRTNRGYVTKSGRTSKQLKHCDYEYY